MKKKQTNKKESKQAQTSTSQDDHLVPGQDAGKNPADKENQEDTHQNPASADNTDQPQDSNEVDKMMRGEHLEKQDRGGDVTDTAEFKQRQGFGK